MQKTALTAASKSATDLRSVEVHLRKCGDSAVQCVFRGLLIITTCLECLGANCSYFNPVQSSVAFSLITIQFTYGLPLFLLSGLQTVGGSTEYSVSLEAVSKGNISVNTHLQFLTTASLLSIMFVF